MIHRVKIEKIIAGGYGLARLQDGPVLMAEHVLPGETVLVRETSRHRGYIKGAPVEIMEASPHRIPPPCPWFARCGGCSFQHADAACQHRLKEAIVREALARAGVAAGDFAYRPLLPSPRQYGYRFRVRLKVDRGRIGFHRAGSNELVEISRCLLATDRINRSLAQLRASRDFRRIATGLREVELHQGPANNRVHAVLHLRGKAGPDTSRLKSFAGSLDIINNVLIKKGKNVLSLLPADEDALLSQDFDAGVCGIPFSLTWIPGCFSQANAPHNPNLISLVCGLLENPGGKRVLDLFCGMGNFSIPLALCGADVTGVDVNREGIARAELNAKAGGIAARFITADAGSYLEGRGGKGDDFATVLLDPPRQGLGRHVRSLAGLAPETILYVSCDPATLARDLSVLAGSGYLPQSVTPVDMFPQTRHIETVVLLKKN
jgi:23S rRNA (uracil1939-C5)-methyltransferase